MGRILAFPERQSANTEVLNLTETEINALTDGLQSGMFISQSTGANAAEYRLFKSQNDCGRIDGVIAFDVAKDKLKDCVNLKKLHKNITNISITSCNIVFYY